MRILTVQLGPWIADLKVLLVEPDYYTRYPSLGLLKIGAYHSRRGDHVELVRGLQDISFTPDKIDITSLFTWDWKPVWRAVQYYKDLFPKAEVRLGGIYASLLPGHARLSGADIVHEGLAPEVEIFRPDYSLVPGWKSSLLFATRGCPRKCGFCSVPKLEGAPTQTEGDIASLIHPDHKKVIFFDNNVLGLPNWNDIFEETIALGLEVDFNQGMDARLITDETAAVIARMKFPVIRLAFDYIGIRPWIERSISTLKEHGIKGRRLIFYALHNYVDDPEDFFERVRDLLSWGAVVYPMRYEPLVSLKKGQYVSPRWTPEDLRMVAQARRVLGYGGALPPYKGLVEKFQNARNFREAFSLRPVGGNWRIPEPVVNMAIEHEQQGSIRKSYFPAWKKEKDWRKVTAPNSSLGK